MSGEWDNQFTRKPCDAGLSVNFAWTATSGYKHYPPYVNLTGNRLAVRGPEVFNNDHYEQGSCVAVDLPNEALAELRAAIASIHDQDGLREAHWKRWPLGDAGDAVDFACDHAKEPVFFLEDWRADRAGEWPDYMKWLNHQRECAALKGDATGKKEEPDGDKNCIDQP